MNRAFLLVAGWVGRGFALALSSARRPAAAEIAGLRERLEKLRAENEILRARLARIEPHVRPGYGACTIWTDGIFNGLRPASVLLEAFQLQGVILVASGVDV